MLRCGVLPNAKKKSRAELLRFGDSFVISRLPLPHLAESGNDPSHVITRLLSVTPPLP